MLYLAGLALHKQIYAAMLVVEDGQQVSFELLEAVVGGGGSGYDLVVVSRSGRPFLDETLDIVIIDVVYLTRQLMCTSTAASSSPSTYKHSKQEWISAVTSRRTSWSAAWCRFARGHNQRIAPAVRGATSNLDEHVV